MVLPRVVILGGGLAGVATAYYLERTGIRNITIVEKDSRIGGLLKTEARNGYTFDIGGSHIIFSKDKSTLQEMLSFLGENYVRNRRNTKIYYRGRFVKYPFENGLRDLPRTTAIKMAIDFTLNSLHTAVNKSNFKRWIYTTFGKEIANAYLIPYNEKVWKRPLEDISTEWVSRIPRPKVRDIWASALGLNTEGYTHQLNFYYPKIGGIESLVRGIANHLKNTKILTNSEAKRIERTDGKWKIECDKSKINADIIISTLPLPELIKILDAPTEITTLTKKLEYNGVITIGFGVDAKIPNYSWLYIPDREWYTNRMSFPSNFSPVAAPQGKSSVLTEITFKPGKDPNLQDAIENTTDAIQTILNIPREKIQPLIHAKFKYAYIVPTRASRKALPKILEYIHSTGIITTGRFGTWSYDNMDTIFRKAQESTHRVRVLANSELQKV